MRCGIPVEGVTELGKGRRHLQAHVEDLALTLKSNIARPFHHAREVTAGLDVLANAKIAGAALDEGILVKYLIRYM